jgi:1,4-alpha-glucan branching enzyme
MAQAPQIQVLPTGIHEGVNYVNDHVVLCLYAPEKQDVYAIGEFSNWEKKAAYRMNQTPDKLRFWVDLGSFPAGQEVAYQYLIDGNLAVADPLTEKILDPRFDPEIPGSTYFKLKSHPLKAEGIVSTFSTGAAAYPWKNLDFKRPKPENLHIYEVLLRDFLSGKRYRALADSIGYFKKLGINAIELMPVMEFSANDSWGYNPIFMLAPDKFYGEKNDLKYLIDQCHGQGIAVILDIVLNQADAQNPYVRMYWDGTKPSNSPFFNSTATHPYSVFYDFNHESPHTQWFVDTICKFWLEEYHIDGYRFDLSKGFTQVNSGSNVEQWGRYDGSRIKLLKRMYDQIRKVDKSAYVILEHFAVANEEHELAQSGMLLWSNAKFDMARSMQGFPQDLGGISYQRRGFEQPNLVTYIESHDEERLLVELGSGAAKTFNQSEKLERAKMATAIWLTIPGPKMMWQWGELGYDISINQNGRTGVKPAKPEYARDPERQKLLQVYQQFGQLRSIKSIFQTPAFTLQTSGIVKQILLSSGASHALLIANTSIETQVATPNLPQNGIWSDYFTGKSVDVTESTNQITLLPGEFHLLTSESWNTKDLGIVPWKVPNLAVLSTNKERAFSVYPNPASDELIIEGAPVGEILLFDLLGRIIYTHALSNGQTRISLAGLPNGTYVLKIGGEWVRISH